MFEFFKGFIGNLELKLIDNFSEKVTDFIDELFKEIKKDKEDKVTEIEASSGDYSQQASSGDGSKQASSGNGSKQASSGYCSQQASSGDYSQQASSGDGSKQASSGNGSKQASSGYCSQQASSGDYSKQASSGDGSKQASSGNCSKQASSGNCSKQASSGDGSQHEANGNNSIAFACGFNSIIKAKKGTWIALAEYEQGNEGIYIPCFAKTAQIGNKEYRDNRNRILKETEFYVLHNKKFYQVDFTDGIKTMVVSEKVRDGITIVKGIDFNDYDEVYIAKEGELSAHGSTLREAIDDLTFKKMEDIDVDEIVKEIKKTEKVTRSQYRAITGACQYGTNQFCKQHKIEELEEIKLEDLRKILVNDYGAKEFWELIDKK